MYGAQHGAAPAPQQGAPPAPQQGTPAPPAVTPGQGNQTHAPQPDIMQAMTAMMQDFMGKIHAELTPLKNTVKLLQQAQEFSEQLERSAEQHTNKFARVDGVAGMAASST